MTELFTNISQEKKDLAASAWDIAIAQNTPAEAAEVLNNIVEYYRLMWTEEEIEFLQFYFNMQMEAKKK